LNVLLITPRIYDFTAFNYWLYPLMELLTADYLDGCGCDVTYINGLEYDRPRKNDLYGKSPLVYTEIPKPQALKNVPKKFKIFGKKTEVYENEIKRACTPHFVIIFQKMTYWYPAVIEAVDIVKKHHPFAKVIIGGNLACLLKDFYSDRNIDAVTAGSFKDLRSVLGISKEVRLEELVPRHGLFMETENPGFFSSITAFGCPLKCQYCINSIKDSPLIYRRPDLTINEIVKAVKKYKNRDIAFYDDYVISNRNIIEILKGIKTEIPEARFHFPNGLPVAGLRPYLPDFKKLSVKTFALGLEFRGNCKSSDQEYIDLFKEIDRLDFAKKDIGINVMVGLPGQKFSDLTQTIRFIKEHSKGYKIKLNEYSPVPGTEYAALHLRESDVDFIKEPLWQNNSLLGFRGIKDFSDARINELKKACRPTII
jgi:radical SAM superfamily enzyme YgiQ (UPF0313 family)